jgi:hypothetical protein
MYIDVRSTHPVLFIGLISFVLIDQPRNISVFDALVLVGNQLDDRFKPIQDGMFERA